MQHLQGDLQTVFDVLYEMGVIEPVLKTAWEPQLVEIEQGSERLRTALAIVDRCANDQARLRRELGKLDRKVLEILALEVAKEYVQFQSTMTLH